MNFRMAIRKSVAASVVVINRWIIDDRFGGHNHRDTRVVNSVRIFVCEYKHIDGINHVAFFHKNSPTVALGKPASTAGIGRGLFTDVWTDSLTHRETSHSWQSLFSKLFAFIGRTFV